MNIKNNILLPILLIIISCAFFILGIYRNEAFAIISRSINICLECVGIG